MNYVELPTKHAVYTYLKSLETNVLCVDLEGEYNLHEYGEKVCLIQLFDGHQLTLFDPLRLDITVLKKKLFENPRLLKVMYGASSDLSVLKNGHGIEAKAILDLQPGVKLLGHTQLNLHAVLHACLGVELENKKKFQTYNWTRRPVDPEAITYALQDVRYLLELKDMLLPELTVQGLLEEFFLENMRLQHKDYTRIPGQRLRKSRDFNTLPKPAKQRFEQLFQVREQYAEQLNIPPHQLIANQHVFQIARNPEQLAQTPLSPKLDRDAAESFYHEVQALFDLP